MKRIPFALLLSTALLASCGVVQSSSSSHSSSSEETLSSSSELESSSSSSSAEESSESTEQSASESSSRTSESSSEEKALSTNPVLEPLFGRQYYLNHIGDIFSAWQSYRGKGQTIAVIDVGFDPYHEDFTYADGRSKVSPLSAAFTKTSTQPSVGLQAVTNLAESHGTFCAGVAAAGANGIGVTGVAPEAELLLLRTDATPTAICKAFDYAREQKVTAITISIGSYYDYEGDLVDDGTDMIKNFTRAVKDCRDEGIPVISAAGNGGLDGKVNEYTFPGAIEGAIGVGGLAANSSVEIWSGSSYNSSSKYQFVDVLAPAENMYGCCNYGGKSYDGGWQGTSFASPIVAGMAALYFEAFPTKGVADFERDLFASSHPITTSKIATKDQLGYGRVDVGALLNLQEATQVTVTVKTSMASLNLFCWNDTKANADWPGVKMSKSNGVFVTTLKPSEYPWMIVNGSSGQTVDILSSVFVSGVILDLTSPASEINCLLGRFIA